MTTLNNATANLRSIQEQRGQRALLKLGATISAGLAAALIGASGKAQEQIDPLKITALARGTSMEHHVELKARGPNDVLQALLVFQPGADTGWHIHPGPVVVIVKSGAITEQKSNGCLVVHPAGSVFFEQKDEAHRAFNQTGMVSEVYATFISPFGAQPLIPVADPGRTCRHWDGR